MRKTKLLYQFTVMTLVLLAGVSIGYAKPTSVVITSIVQRADGVFFGIKMNGTNQIISAGQAQILVERTCPTIKFAPGVLQ